MDYLDFGSSSDSDQDDDRIPFEDDSDEEERRENKTLLRMLNLGEPPSKIQRNIQDFEAEMEAELDRRACEIELKGGVEHQKSLSRSSSSNSLSKSPRASPVPGTSSSTVTLKEKGSCLKRTHDGFCSDDGSQSKSKSVRFALPDASSEAGGSAKVTSAVHLGESDKKAKEMYDELYFDSDEEEDNGEEKDAVSRQQRKESARRFMTDDELFYDPSSDAKDQAWMDKQRRRSYGQKDQRGSHEGHELDSDTSAPDKQGEGNLSEKDTKTPGSSSAPLLTTDAILNCPACFTVVCQDCQRHEVYVGQYRAMFVINCVINQEETLRVPEKAPKKFKKRKGNESRMSSLPQIPQFINNSNSSSDIFHPVVCKICKTQVAMYDSDEVYHFFNVLASRP